MALEFKDRVSDTSATTGTGTLTLAGSAPTGFRAFAAAGFTTGATVRYCITSSDLTQWEVGQGVWTSSGTTLSRATVYASSNANALVSFTGTLTVANVPMATDFVRPAFRAYRATSQTVTATTFTKIQLPSVSFDTCGGFDATTNYRWTPTVAGYYMVSGAVIIATASTRLLAAIYKNGSVVSRGTDTSSGFSAAVSDVIYLNGSTDYVELWVFTGATTLTPTDSSHMYLSGALISGAS